MLYAQYAAVCLPGVHIFKCTYIFSAVARETGDATARPVQLQRWIIDVEVEQVRPRHILSDSTHLTKQAAGRSSRRFLTFFRFDDHYFSSKIRIIYIPTDGINKVQD
jgi:hypothetical protein